MRRQAAADKFKESKDEAQTFIAKNLRGRKAAKQTGQKYFAVDGASDKIGNIYRQILADRKAKAAAAGPQGQTSPSTIDTPTAASKESETTSNEAMEKKKA